MILLIDNYDSFTYNLYQYMGELGETVEVVRNDQITLDEIAALNPEAVVLSPGPGTPSEAGICVDLIKRFKNDIPILGICLGHQAIGEAFGGVVSHAKRVMHGKQSNIRHTFDALYTGLDEVITVMRYHSLVILPETMPEELMVTAQAVDDFEIMSIKHRELPIFGMQFHPESIGTTDGHTLLRNFFTAIREDEVK